MKRKANYTVKTIGDVNILLPSEGDAALTGVMTLNETGIFIWDMLAEDRTEGEIVSAMAKEYAAPEEVLEADVKAFVAKLEKHGLLE